MTKRLLRASIAAIALTLSAPNHAAQSTVAALVNAALSRGTKAEAPADQTIEVGFSPDAGAEQLVLKSIHSARASIRLTAYSFTSKPVIQALIDARRRGVDVRCVLDKSNADERGGKSGANLLVNAAIPVKIDSAHAIQHSKTMVIDGRHVETGSFNFSSAAAHKNAENALIIWNNPDLAKIYREEWDKHWNHSQEWRSSY